MNVNAHVEVAAMVLAEKAAAVNSIYLVGVLVRFLKLQKSVS